MANWTTEGREFSIRQRGQIIDGVWQWALKCPGCGAAETFYTDFIALPSGTTTIGLYCKSCDETHPCPFDAPT